MSSNKGLPGWVWLLAVVPVAVIAVGMAATLAIYGVRRYIADARQAEAAAAASVGAPSSVAEPVGVSPYALDGTAVDLSTVMGRARKLADAWQREAALLGIEATLSSGKIQTGAGGTAKLTFGPSPFAAPPSRSGLFVVIYDKSGISGAPTSGSPGKALPEPMCAPEHVLPLLRELGDGPFSLRYAFDASQRPMWLASPTASPEQVRLVDPQDCRVRGLVAPRKQR